MFWCYLYRQDLDVFFILGSETEESCWEGKWQGDVHGGREGGTEGGGYS